ncbi:MAG: YceI family protein [Saprospiraceae bacterium]
MRSFFLSIFALAISMSLFAANIIPDSKDIKIAGSTVIWKASKVTGTHDGNVKFKGGSLTFEGDILIGGDLIVDMTTVEVTDLSGGGKAKLEGHLKSDDFFGVTNHPTAKIKFTKVTPRGITGEYRVTANITIKNITKEIKFNATLKDGVANTSIKLDRSDFDIRYGSGSFFDNLGDKTIFDEFDLNITVAY